MPDISPGPLPAFIRAPLRALLRVWARYPKAPGYLYQIVERWGERLSVEPLQGRLFNGAMMWCDLADHVQRQIYFRGAYEPIESYLVRNLLQRGMIVIDVGANVGQYTLIAGMEVGAEGEVHAFEPVPTTCKRLRDHVLANGLAAIVRVNQLALWHQTGAIQLRRPSGAGNAALYTVAELEEPEESVFTTAIRLDDYVIQKQIKRVDFMKLDVEGSEWFVLQGATTVLSHWRPLLLVEINRQTCRRLGYGPEMIWDSLKPYGYSMWSIGESPESCCSLSTLDRVQLANVIFHAQPLPENVTKGWTYKSILRFHRRGDSYLQTQRTA